MKRKVQLTYQPLHRFQQPLNIHVYTPSTNAHDGKRRIAWFGNVFQAQDLGVNHGQFLTELGARRGV